MLLYFVLNVRFLFLFDHRLIYLLIEGVNFFNLLCKINLNQLYVVAVFLSFKTELPLFDLREWCDLYYIHAQTSNL